MVSDVTFGVLDGLDTEVLSDRLSNTPVSEAVVTEAINETYVLLYRFLSRHGIFLFVVLGPCLTGVAVCVGFIYSVGITGATGIT